MKNALMFITSLLIWILGLVLIGNDAIFAGLIFITIAVIIFILAIKNISKKMVKPKYYNPDWTANKLIINSAFQLFESMLIVVQTKELKTFISRIEYIKQRYPFFIQQSNTDFYSKNIERASALVCKKFNLVSVPEMQMEILITPSPEGLDKFIGSAIVVRYGEFVKSESEVIDTLIRPNVIRNRKIKIIETGNNYKLLLRKLEVTNSEPFISAIEEIQAAFSID